MTGWCEYCHQYGKHLSACPNYEPVKSRHECKICGEVIYEGEACIKNYNDEYVHYDCATTDDLVQFFDGSFCIMEVDDG